MNVAQLEPTPYKCAVNKCGGTLRVLNRIPTKSSAGPSEIVTLICDCRPEVHQYRKWPPDEKIPGATPFNAVRVKFKQHIS